MWPLPYNIEPSMRNDLELLTTTFNIFRNFRTSSSPGVKHSKKKHFVYKTLLINNLQLSCKLQNLCDQQCERFQRLSTNRWQLSTTQCCKKYAYAVLFFTSILSTHLSTLLFRFTIYAGRSQQQPYFEHGLLIQAYSVPYACRSGWCEFWIVFVRFKNDHFCAEFKSASSELIPGNIYYLGDYWDYLCSK
jgi:hypothetical protein